MRRLFGKATKRRISSKGQTTGVTTRIATVLMPITQDQFQSGVRNKAGYILYIFRIRKVQVRGLAFDPGLRFSFVLIEILSKILQLSLEWQRPFTKRDNCVAVVVA